jgi:hypothetical protein
MTSDNVDDLAKDTREAMLKTLIAFSKDDISKQIRGTATASGVDYKKSNGNAVAR